MSHKKFGLGCITVLGAAIALGVGGRYLSRQVLGKELTPLDAARVIPDEALFTTFVETDSEKWSEVKGMVNQQSQNILETQIEKFETELSTELTDFDYQKDIQPWLDGAMFAFVGEDIVDSNADADVLVILGVKNKLKANNFAKKLQAKSQAKLQESKYKRIKITESTTKNNELAISALIGNRLLLAEERDTIKRAIDAYKEDSSLASDSQTKKVFEQKLDKGTSLAQIYFPNYPQLISQGMNIDPDVPNLYSELMSVYTSIESTTMTLGVESQGLHVQSVTKLNSDEFSKYITPNKSKLLKRFPDRTVAVVSGSGISQFWSQLLVFLKQNRDTGRYLNLAKLGVRQATNLDLESDIFNWMDGEFAFGIVTTSKSLHPQFDLNYSAGLILETSQPELAQKTLIALENSLQRNFAIAPTQNKIDKKAVTQWQAPGVEVALNYGWLDKNNLLFAWDDFTFESISQSSKQSLAKSESFEAITKKIPDRNLGYFYLDVAQVMNTVNQLPIPQSNPETEEMLAFLNSLDAIASYATMPDKRTAQQDVFVMFKDN